MTISHSPPSRIGIALGALVFTGASALYFALPGTFGPQKFSGDGWDNYAMTRSLIFDRDLDLANEFRSCCNQFPHPPDPRTGHPTSAHPIGTPLLWLPFLGTTHLLALLVSSIDSSQATNGYGNFYFVGTAFGSVFYGSIGLILIALFLARHLRPFAAWLATMVLLVATPLGFYMIFHPSYGHPQSMFAVALCIWYWDRTFGEQRWSRWAILGALTGLIALTREQYVLTALAPGCELAWYLASAHDRLWLRRILLAARNVMLAAAVALIVFSPQMAVWHYFFGSWLTVPQGNWYMQWSRFSFENLLNLLFWSRNGLVTWHPLYLIAFAGLMLAVIRIPARAVPVAVTLVAQLYVNSVCSDPWAGWSFGHRRFIEAAPFFALGLGLVFDEIYGHLAILGRRWATTLLLAGLAPYVILASAMAVRVWQHNVHVAVPQDMREVYGIASWPLVGRIWHTIGNPFAFPATGYYWLRYGLPAERFDEFVGDYRLYRFEPSNGPVRETMTFTDPGAQSSVVGGIAMDTPNGQRGVSGIGDGADGTERIRLVIPLWLITRDLSLDLFYATIDDGGAQSADVPVLARFNGLPYFRIWHQADQGLHVMVPWRVLNWGLNELTIDIGPYADGAAALLLTRIDLESWH